VKWFNKIFMTSLSIPHYKRVKFWRKLESIKMFKFVETQFQAGHFISTETPKSKSSSREF